MIRYLSLVFIFYLSGCSTLEPIKLFNTEEFDDTSLVKVHSECGEQCKDAVFREYGYEKTTFPIMAKLISKVTLYSIDGRKGSHSIMINDCGGSITKNIHNQLWGWDFSFKLAPGNHEFILGKNDCTIKSISTFKLKIDLKEGEEYVIGHIQRSNIKNKGVDGGEKDWFPIVYNQTTDTIVFGKIDAGWLSP